MLTAREAPGAPPHAPHPLHDPARTWPLSSCYADLWIELLHGAGLDPHPALGFAACVEWEGDQFTFLKPHPGDFETLYGLHTQELALWDTVEGHVAAQLARGRPVLLEVDAVHLPDLTGGGRAQGHSKTTVAIVGLNAREGRCSYVHNASRDVLSGAGYDAVLRAPGSGGGLPLPPYAEVVKRRGRGAADPAAGHGPHEAALGLLRAHLARRATRAQVPPFRGAFPRQLDALCARPAGFHGWAFNTLRQFGAGAGLLGDLLGWLEARHPMGLGPAAAKATDLAAGAKALQFRVARLVARGRMDGCTDLFDALEADEAALAAGLEACLA